MRNRLLLLFLVSGLACRAQQAQKEGDVDLVYFCKDAVIPSATAACPVAVKKGSNANSVAAILSPGETKYNLSVKNRVTITATCKDTSCTPDLFTSLKARITSLARPNQEILPTPGMAKDTAQKINSLYGPQVLATALPPNDQVEVASLSPIPADIAAAFRLAPPAWWIDFPFYCVSTSLEGHAPVLSPPGVCGPSDQRVQPVNASDIATALGKDKDASSLFSYAAQGTGRVLVTCTKGGCLQADMDRIAVIIRGMAVLSPAYIQDIDVPAGSAASAAKDLTTLKFKGMTADALGTKRIRLKSDVPVSQEDVDALLDHYLYGHRAPPEFRMFYQDAGAVVSALTPPASANNTTTNTGGGNTPSGNTPSGNTGNSSPITYTVKTDTSTTPPPASPPTPPNAAGGGAAGNPGAKGTSSPSTSTSTSSTTTITPPAAPAPTPTPPAAPTPPPPIGKNLQAFSDNVVFTDTSSDDTIMQQIRLLTLLDLPRPEVLLNVWSYQASSPDDRDVEGRAEKLRDLVSGQNQTLENSIQYGWTYLSHQMNLDPLHIPGVSQSPRQPAATNQTPPPPPILQPQRFFDHDFYDYITQKFVSDPYGNLNSFDRAKWGFCPVGKFCLGFTHAFQPLKPNLTSILLGAIASDHPLQTILKTIGCMEGKYEVYSDCFQERSTIFRVIHLANEDVKQKSSRKLDSKAKGKTAALVPPDCPDCQKQKESLHKALETLDDQHCPQCQSDLQDMRTDLAAIEKNCPDCLAESQDAAEKFKTLEQKYSEHRTNLQALSAEYAAIQDLDCAIEAHVVDELKIISSDCPGCRQKTEPPSDRDMLASVWLPEVRRVVTEVQRRVQVYTEGLMRLGAIDAVLLRIRCPDCSIGSLRDIVSKLRTAYADRQSVLRDLAALLQGLETACPECTNALGQLDRVVAALDMKCSLSAANLAGLGVKIAGLSAYYPAPVDEVIDVEKALNALRPDCPDCQGDTQRTTPELKPLEVKCPKWLDEIKTLQDLLPKNCKECTALSDALEPLKKQCPNCEQQLQTILRTYARTLRAQIKVRTGLQNLLSLCPSCEEWQNRIEETRTCLRTQRHKLLHDDPQYRGRLSCEVLDAVALKAEESCNIAQTFPMSCFTIQATQSFSLTNTFSTFTLEQLNELAEEPLASLPIVGRADASQNYGTTRVGLMRAAVADFLFHYKMSQEFPQEFTPYDLQHSAQELNAELNPLVIAFNQDVAAFSHHLTTHLDAPVTGQLLFSHLWPNRKSFLSDGLITVRGIGGLKSSVNTATQNYFDATQAQSLSSVLNSFTGQGAAAGGGSGSSPAASLIATLEKSGVNPTTALSALAALTPTPTQAKIGRQLNFTVTPHTLPGASSAELDVQLLADESADSGTLYQSGKPTGTDTLSRVSQHDITTRVRVESVKLFELSSFSALLQRPRSKVPLIPPFVELPFIGSFASIPLPGLKEWHRSTAIVSAVIVPTATDLAYGIDFVRDRIVTRAQSPEWQHVYEMQPVISLSQFPRTPIRAFHNAIVNCLATNGGLLYPGGMRSQSAGGCATIDFRTVPPEF